MAHGALERCLERSLRCVLRAAGPLTGRPTSCASTERAGRCLVTLAAHSRSSQEPLASLLPLGLPALGKFVSDRPCAGAPVLCCARRLSSGSGGDGKDADAAEPAPPADPAAECAGAARADGGPPEPAAPAAAAEPRLSSAAAGDAAAAGGAAQQAAGSPAAGGAAGAGAGAGGAAEPAAAAGPGSERAGGAGEAGVEGRINRELEAVASGSDSGDEGWESGEDWSEDDFDEEGVDARLEQGAAEQEAWLKTLSPKERRKIANADRVAQRQLRRRVLEGDPDEGLTEEQRRRRREERGRAGAAADVRAPGLCAACALASPEGPRLCCAAGARHRARVCELVHGRPCVRVAVHSGQSQLRPPPCAPAVHTRGAPYSLTIILVPAVQVRKLTSQQRREQRRRLERRKEARAMIARMALGEDGMRLLGNKELRRRDLRSMRNLADPMFADQVRRTPRKPSAHARWLGRARERVCQLPRLVLSTTCVAVPLMMGSVHGSIKIDNVVGLHALRHNHPPLR